MAGGLQKKPGKPKGEMPSKAPLPGKKKKRATAVKSVKKAGY